MGRWDSREKASFSEMGYCLIKQKKKKGLGVRYLNSLNKALICKWIWCFAKKMDAFWRKVICGKFGELEGAWCS